MKKAFPSLQKKKPFHQTETHSETPDISRLSCDTPRRFEDIFDIELSRLDKELDLYEISSLNSDLKEFFPYRSYLQTLAVVLKKKQPVLSAKLLRGITGWDKAMNFYSKIEKKQRKKSILILRPTKDSETQTEADKETEPRHVEDIQKFLSLPKSVKKIKISRLTAKLKDIYEKLKILDTQVPSGSSTPEMEEFDIEDLRLSPGLKLKFQRIEEAKVLGKTLTGKLRIDKEVQVGKFVQEYLVDEGGVDLEIAFLRKKRELETALSENLVLAERIKKLNDQRESRKNTRIEDKSVENREASHDRSLENAMGKFETLNNRVNKQDQRIVHLDKMVFNAKVLWKCTEDRLKQISSVWERDKGNSFNFKPVDFKKIIEEIRNNQESDNKIIENAVKEVEKFGLDLSPSKKLDEKYEKKKEKQEKQENKVSKITEKNPKKKEQNKEENKGNRISIKEKLRESISKENKKLDLSSDENTENPAKQKQKIIKDVEKQDFSGLNNRADLPQNTETSPISSKLTSISKPQTKQKLVSFELKSPNLDPNLDPQSSELSSKTQKLKKTKIDYSQIPNPSLPNSEIQSVRQKIRKFPAKSLEGISEDNYEDLLLKSLPPDQAFTLKKFITALLKRVAKQSKPNEPGFGQDTSQLTEKGSDNLNSFRLDQPFDFLDVPEKEKSKDLLRKVFNAEELRQLPQAAKVKINQLMISHDIQCEDVCDHLKRVMAIKFKVFGLHYPLKTQTLRFI